MLILLEVPPLDSEADAVGPSAHSCLIIPKDARIFRAEAVPPGCLHLTPFAFHSIRTSRWIVIYCPDSPAPSLAKNSPQVISAGNEVGSVLGHGKGLEAWLPCMVSSPFASVLSGLCLGALPVREREDWCTEEPECSSGGLSLNGTQVRVLNLRPGSARVPKKLCLASLGSISLS